MVARLNRVVQRQTGATGHPRSGSLAQRSIRKPIIAALVPAPNPEDDAIEVKLLGGRHRWSMKLTELFESIVTGEPVAAERRTQDESSESVDTDEQEEPTATSSAEEATTTNEAQEAAA